jgi:hypothetical protein
VYHSAAPRCASRWGKGHIAQISLEIIRLTGSLLRGNLQSYVSDELSEPGTSMRDISQKHLDELFVLLATNIDEAISKRLHLSDLVRKTVGMDLSTTGDGLSHVYTMRIMIEMTSKKKPARRVVVI